MITELNLESDILLNIPFQQGINVILGESDTAINVLKCCCYNIKRTKAVYSLPRNLIILLNFPDRSYLYNTTPKTPFYMPEKFYFIQDQQVSNSLTALKELNEIISLDKKYEDYTLIWKLPETGLLPQSIIEIISGLKELSKNHQIIISTNSYFLLKELEIQIEEPINYICIHKDGVENSTSIYDLEHEPIISAYVDQYKRSIGGIT